ncbi:hypothetical protein [Okeania sp.]|uniref:hypothetical protein n=1 Tax=Okeania sp. TaxID=3100323 RepID=UPI002B4B7884|nr:hypothetical protein [Okeania sp.]MEB3343361.1 hypothetical protein [Okeania sp.]
MLPVAQLSVVLTANEGCVTCGTNFGGSYSFVTANEGCVTCGTNFGGSYSFVTANEGCVTCGTNFGGSYTVDLGWVEVRNKGKNLFSSLPWSLFEVDE